MATGEELTGRLRTLENKLWTRSYLMKIAEFDGATIAPENGAAARGEAMAALAGEHHELLTGADAVTLVAELERAVAGDITDPKLVAQIRTLARDQREALAFPTEEVEAWSRLTCEADAVWHKAKAADDWASFEPLHRPHRHGAQAPGRLSRRHARPL